MKKKALVDDVQFGGAAIQAAGYRWRFLTLTLSPKADQDRISVYWARLRAYLRKMGYRFDFFKVTEFTKNGIRHYHVLVSAFIPWGLIKHAWYLATEKTSNIVHIKKTQIRAAGAYMSKYMTKQSTLSNQFKKGERRYSFSRGFPRLPKPEPSGRYTFTYSPNDKAFVQDARGELAGRLQRRREWAEACRGDPPGEIHENLTV